MAGPQARPCLTQASGSASSQTQEAFFPFGLVLPFFLVFFLSLLSALLLISLDSVPKVAFASFCPPLDFVMVA